MGTFLGSAYSNLDVSTSDADTLIILNSFFYGPDHNIT